MSEPRGREGKERVLSPEWVVGKCLLPAEGSFNHLTTDHVGCTEGLLYWRAILGNETSLEHRRSAYHVDAAAKAYGLSRTTLYKLLAEGRLEICPRRPTPADPAHSLEPVGGSLICARPPDPLLSNIDLSTNPHVGPEGRTGEALSLWQTPNVRMTGAWSACVPAHFPSHK